MERAFKSIREVRDEVQHIRGIFEGKGSIQQIHYSQATTTLRHVAYCVIDLDATLLQPTPLPKYLGREQIITDLRHMIPYVKESIEHIASYSTLSPQQQKRNRKDTESRLSTILAQLDELSRHVLNGPL